MMGHPYEDYEAACKSHIRKVHIGWVVAIISILLFPLGFWYPALFFPWVLLAFGAIIYSDIHLQAWRKELEAWRARLINDWNNYEL